MSIPKITTTSNRLDTIPKQLGIGDSSNINLQPFAGRIGANQVFAIAVDDPSYLETKDRIPDAARDPKWRDILSFSGFTDLVLWRAALVEGFAVCFQQFLGGLLLRGLVPTSTETSVGAIFPNTYAAITQVIIFSLFTYACGPVSGAHFNPLISLATLATRLSSLPRTVLYIFAQCIGAIVGSFLLKASFGLSSDDLIVVPGCYIDAAVVTPGEAFGAETVTSLILLFLAFGLGLEPRNATSFGPALAPILIGSAIAILVFASGIARDGYSGSANNPARCLGFMSASHHFVYHYVQWTGALCAVLIHGLLYATVPPFSSQGT